VCELCARFRAGDELWPEKQDNCCAWSEHLARPGLSWARSADGQFREAQRFLDLSHTLPSTQDEAATKVEQLLVA
jgi:hypothetical protein